MSRRHPTPPAHPANLALKAMRREMELLARQMAKAKGRAASRIFKRMGDIAAESGKLMEQVSGVPYPKG